jgi:pimeloyl-ACP methyl ester carboxylesterase
VIAVEWSALAAGPNYPMAAANSKVAGIHIAEFLEDLLESTGAQLEDFHVIGFSLGGQG